MGKRLAAKAIDLALYAAAAMPLFQWVFVRTLEWRNIAPVAAILLCYPLLQAISTRRWQSTIGKRLLSLRIVDIEGRRIGWVQAFERQAVPLAMVTLWCLHFSQLLPGAPAYPGADPTPDQAKAFSDAFMEMAKTAPSSWADFLQLAIVLFLGSLTLGLIRPDHRTLQDLWSGTVVVEPQWSRGTGV